MKIHHNRNSHLLLLLHQPRYRSQMIRSLRQIQQEADHRPTMNDKLIPAPGVYDLVLLAASPSVFSSFRVPSSTSGVRARDSVQSKVAYLSARLSDPEEFLLLATLAACFA